MPSSRLRRAAALILVLAAVAAASGSVFPEPSRALRVKNFILMIPDGMGPAHSTLGRWYKYAKTGVNRLSFDDLACGQVRTYWATGLVTDSAHAASAMATGFKTTNAWLGVLPLKVSMPDVPPFPADKAGTPVATVLEAAKAKGLATGLVVTCELPHATPAGFSSHYVQRSAMELIAEQQVYQGLDIALGGGRKYLDPKIRKDKEDLISVLRGRGYQFVTSPAELAAVSRGRVWGTFAEAGMARDIDRDPAKEPGLDEMTRKALALLAGRKNGFFLMVEGSEIDWGAHSNDPVGTASEMLAFDRAVAEVLDFARRDGQTAVLISADHSTGGLSVGVPEGGEMSMERFAAALKAPTATPTKTADEILADPGASPARAVEIASGRLGIGDWKPSEIAEIEAGLKDKSAKKLETALAKALSRRAGVGWVSTAHGGEDVTLYAYHPKGLRPQGVIQNTDIARYVERCLRLNLAAQTAERFVRADELFAPLGATLTADTAEAENPVLTAAAGGRMMRIPADKDYALLDGKPVDLGGIVVCTGGAAGASVKDVKTWFLPRRAAALLRAAADAATSSAAPAR